MKADTGKEQAVEDAHVKGRHLSKSGQSPATQAGHQLSELDGAVRHTLFPMPIEQPQQGTRLRSNRALRPAVAESC